MFNTGKLENIIAAYKESFPMHWEDEKYKWEAIKHFQDHWDINASDFVEMFMAATAKTYNLLASSYYFPRAMIKDFAEADAEAARAMFINLYDESQDLDSRVERFISDAELIRSTHGADTWGQHYQNANSISTYLWLRYPDKYYIYKYSEYLDVARELESDYKPKRGGSSSNLIESFRFYDEIRQYLKADDELVDMLRSKITDNCYPDKELITLTFDVGFYVSRKYSSKDQNNNEWFPKDYDPNISVETWLELLADDTIFYPSNKEIMKRMKDYGGMATCTQLSIEYGETPNFYNSGSSSLAKRIANKTGCPVNIKEEEDSGWWSVLYVGKYADEDETGCLIWKLRDELSEALDKFDLSDVSLYANETSEKGYWWLTASPKIWSFSNIAVGEVIDYTLHNDNGNKRRIYQNFLDAKAGDLVIGYESNPAKQIVSLAKVTLENDGEYLYFEKTEDLLTPIDYSQIKNSPELGEMEFIANPNGSFFKLTSDEYKFIMDLVREVNPLVVQDTIELYSKKDFLQEVYMTEAEFDTLTSLLNNKKNLILQGAPGVGKTFSAKRLAYAIMGEKDDSRIEFIQFHQNYSYEDFVLGYKPEGESFELKKGIFYRFCQKAANDPERPYFFIIDEINRGNMSKIFGELLMSIEKDYRGKKITLAYDMDKPFMVPRNLRIIGMMNTADRSLAMIDYALRRRFSFYEMEAGFDSEGFKGYQEELDNEIFNTLIDRVKELNKEISSDNSLGKGFCIGHSYFCGQTEAAEKWIIEVVEYEILPMLSEYWFDEPSKLQKWENIFRGVYND